MYVITRELDQHRRSFFESYLAALHNPQEASGRVGVGISGFFGSGKSHFLNILAYLLENKQAKTANLAGPSIFSSEKLLTRCWLPISRAPPPMRPMYCCSTSTARPIAVIAVMPSFVSF